MVRSLQIRRLGRVEYADGLALQARLAAARNKGLVPDTLLLLEHPRVLTLGSGAAGANILWTRAQLAAQGFEVFETNRGGDVTYHGPGQLVGYPVLDLKPDRKDVRRYVSSVEELMIRSAGDFGVESARVPGRTGIWVETPRGPEKLGAIGVHLSRWITSHGFAFNVTTDLADFAAIVPCGISDAGVCSLESLRPPAPAWDTVLDRFVANAANVWESEPEERPIDLETIALAIVREGLHGDEVLLLHRVPERGGFWQLLTGRQELGESPLQTAARELYEETGFSPRLEELEPLGSPRSFALDPALLGASVSDTPTAPACARETMFTLRVEPGAGPRLEPREHDAFRWVSLDEADALLPFPGHRRAARAVLTARGPPP